MTKKEINKEIKMLKENIYEMTFRDNSEYFEYMEKTAKPEFIRLYNADPTFDLMSIDSLKTMIRLNLTNRFISLHSFGIKL